MLKRIVAILLMAVMVFTLAACNSKPATPGTTSAPAQAGTKPDEKNPQGELRLSIQGDPVTFNSILSSDTASSDIHGYIYEGLYRVNEKLEWIPRLAKEMPKVSPDGLVWDVTLRNDVKFHDGKQFTAKDVKFLYDAMMSPDYTGPRASAVTELAKVEIVNDYQVKFTLKRPFAPFYSTLSYGILPSHLYADKPIKDMKDNPVNLKPVGTGPFKFVTWEKGQYLILEANTDYWAPGPYIKTLRFKQMQDSTVAQAALEANEIDYASIKADDVDRVKKERSNILDIVQFENRGYEYFSINGALPMFQDVRVRQALACGLNRDKIIKDVLKGYARAVDSLYPASSWAYSDKVQPVKYDPAKANQLLDEAGWKKGADGIRAKDGQKLAFKLTTNDNAKTRIDYSTVAQSDWKALGIDVQLDIMEWSVMLNTKIYKGNYDVAAMGWSLGVDPDAYNIWHSSQADKKADGTFKGLNRVNYRNPEADKLIDQGRSEVDQAKRKAIYGQLSEIIAKDVPYVFLYQSLGNVGLNKRVKDLTKGADGFYFWEKAWVDTSLPVK